MGKGEGQLKEQCLHNECGQINHNRSIVDKNPHQQIHEKVQVGISAMDMNMNCNRN